MTAESAVMNKLGVALAADSAVTASSRGADKVYSSSDKLFQLSDTAPVAIMKSGNADFLGMPWEVLINVYRQQLGEATFPRLADYASDFFRFVSKFVRTNATIFPRSVQDAWVEIFVENLLENIRDEANERYEGDKWEAPDQSNKNMLPVIHEVAAEFLKEKRQDSKLHRFGAATAHALRAKHAKTVKKAIKDYFDGFSLSAIPDKTRRLLEQLVFESIARANFDSGDATNIVLAGFGEEEYLPAYLKYAVDGWADNKLRHYRDEEGRISPEKSGDVGLFGQHGPALAVVMGVSLQYLPYMRKYVDEFVEKTTKSFARVTGHKYVDRETKKLNAAVEKQHEALIKKIIEYFEEVGDEFENAVGHLPKSELAAAAETLVNITKFSQRVSAEQETVGGPVDVALITKVDGFVWVKRKQYFPAKLNSFKVSHG